MKKYYFDLDKFSKWHNEVPPEEPIPEWAKNIDGVEIEAKTPYEGIPVENSWAIVPLDWCRCVEEDISITQ